MLSEEEVRQLLVETKAVLEGHFLLTSGLHSPLYVESSMFFSIPNTRKSSARNWQNGSKIRISRLLWDL